MVGVDCYEPMSELVGTDISVFIFTVESLTIGAVLQNRGEELNCEGKTTTQVTKELTEAIEEYLSDNEPDITSSTNE